MFWSTQQLSPPEVLMCDLLVRRGFSTEEPDILLAWDAFTEFAAAPIPSMPDFCVGYVCFHESDRDEVLWLEFVRQNEAGVRCGCVFSRVVPKELWGVSESWWWWPEHGTLADWVARVELMTGFNICPYLSGWEWEGFCS
jgi:hypothetical protein